MALNKMLLSLIAIIGCLGVESARADQTIFFGGVGARKSVTSACYPAYENFSYPVSQAQLDRLIARINGSPRERFTLIGHSSGAKFSNYIADRVKNPGRITVTALDGYAPRGLPKEVRTICWKATNGEGVWSRNAGSMVKGNNCKIVKTQLARRCQTPWCLHFAIVNLNVPPALGGKDFIARGYEGCRPGPFTRPPERRRKAEQPPSDRRACSAVGQLAEGCEPPAAVNNGRAGKPSSAPGKASREEESMTSGGSSSAR
jgi:hypothetical protein